ncbi:hypothetical protein D3C80_2159750 [compost metagenome]
MFLRSQSRVSLVPESRMNVAVAILVSGPKSSINWEARMISMFHFRASRPSVCICS